MTEILIQILLVAAILVAIMSLILMFKLNDILVDTKKICEIASRRAKQIDEIIDQTENGLKSAVDAFKGLIYSIDIVKAIKNKLVLSKEEKNDK